MSNYWRPRRKPPAPQACAPCKMDNHHLCYGDRGRCACQHSTTDMLRSNMQAHKEGH